MSESEPVPSPNRLLAWLQLARFAAVFTTFADIGAGFVLVRGSWFPLEHFLPLLLSSGCLYAAGMILNDYFDRDVDLVERPKRPIPSGRVSAAAAARAGFGLLFVGVALAFVTGPLSGTVAVLLATCVLTYDSGLKQTFLGPVAMGSCRSLNFLLGASVLTVIARNEGDPVGLIDNWQTLLASRPALLAAGTGLYIAGVTWFARHEAGVSPRWQLVLALAVADVGIGWLAWQVLQLQATVVPQLNIALILGLVGVTLNRRCLAAVMDPSPGRVQGAIRLMLMSLIVLDATLALTVSPPWPYPALILALLLPVWRLGKLLAIT